MNELKLCIVSNLDEFRENLEEAKRLITSSELWYGKAITEMSIVNKLIDVENLITYILSLTEQEDKQ